MLLSPHERMITSRYLKARRSESFIGVIIGFAMIGIALGVMTLVVVTSVMNGVREEMLKHFIGMSGHLHIYSTQGNINNSNELIDKINVLNEVKRALPTIEGQVMVTRHGVSRGAQVKACDFSSLEGDSYLKQYVDEDSWRRFTEGQGILMGSQMADLFQRHSRQPLSQLTLISPDGRHTAIGMIPRMKSYSIAGIFTFGINMIDGNLIVLPYQEAQRYFKLENGPTAHSIEVTLHSIDQTEAMARKIQSTLGKHYRVVTWQQTNGAVFEALNVQRSVMFLVLLMILLVAAFNIIASLVMLVKDKQRDIAVMRAFGVTRYSIQKIFVMMGLRIGAMATLIGVVAGCLIASYAENFRQWFEATTGQQLLGGNLYFLSTLPAKIDPFEIALVVAMALVLSFLATLYPAKRAARLNPAEALRYE